MAAVLSGLFYTGLRSELPIDDTLSYGPHIAAGVFEWDSSHLLMQPAVVLWHRYLGFGGTARASQEHFNAFCAAVSIGVFYLLLVRLGVSARRRVLLTVLAACSYNLFNLATSGHVKLAVLPFLTLSLFHAALWERHELAGGSGRPGLLAASAVELGVACAFLINSALVAPFLGAAVLAVSLRAGRGIGRSLGRAAGFGALSGATATALLGTVYAFVSAGPASPGGFFSFLLAKSAARPPFAGVAESLARGVFGVVQSFVYVGDFGAMLRTWMSGDGSFLAAHRRTFVIEGLIFLAAAALLAWIYGEAGLRLLRGRGVAAVPWAFMLGALAFAIPWNLNESDFYFQIVLPTVAMMSMMVLGNTAWRRVAAGLLVALVTLVTSTVLFGWALPKRRYPLSRYNAELRSRLTPRDLAVYWLEYTGGPSLIFMKLPGVPRLHPDHLYVREPDRFFPRLARAVDGRLAAGGRVYLFGILDGRTWHSPWPVLRREGLTETRLETFFRQRYRVVDRGEIAEIPCWELLPLEEARDHGTFVDLSHAGLAPAPVRVPAVPVPDR